MSLVAHECAWILLSGKNAGKRCPKKFYGRDLYCPTHYSKGTDKDYLQKYGMNYQDYQNHLLELERIQQEKEAAEFKQKHGMTPQEYTQRFFNQQLDWQKKEKEELEARERLLEKIREDPDYQVKEIGKGINEFLKSFFDPEDCYMDLVRGLQAEATPEGIITLSDGRKFRVGLIPL